MPRTSPAKPQLDSLTQDLQQCKTKDQAINRFNVFCEHIFVNHKLYEPKNYQEGTWKGWVRIAKTTIKKKFPGIEFPKVWFNRADVFNAETDKAMAAALKDACREQNKALHNHIFGNDEPTPSEAQPAPVQTAPESQPQQFTNPIALTDEVKQAIERSGLPVDDFNARALSAYAKNWKPSECDLTAMSTQELLGSRRSGAGEELCDRAIRAILKHNETTKDTDSRLHVTGAILKTLTGVNAKTCKAAMEQYAGEIAASYESVGITGHEWHFNRGKDAKAIIGEF